MPVYVDNLRDYGWRHGLTCHLFGDSLAELMEFAERIGMKPEWFHAERHLNFILTAEGRDIAVQNGAIELNQREFVAKLRELREKTKSRLEF
jgi:hypothetical protein